MSVESTIQRVHDGLLNDLLQLASKYEFLRKSDPVKFAHEVKADIRLYLDGIRNHPTMLEFYTLCKVNQEEFINDIYDTAILMLFRERN